MTTTVKTSIPSKRMSTSDIAKIAHRIATMALQPEFDLLNAKYASIVNRLTDCLEAAVDGEVMGLIRAPFRPRQRAEQLKLNYVGDTYHSRAYFSFTPSRPIFEPVGMEWREIPKDVMEIFPADLIDEARGYSAMVDELSNRQHQLYRELVTNLTAARTIRNACQLWPEAAAIILEVTDIAAEVEVPLESILGRYLKALPAPSTDAANDNATDDQSAVAN